MNRYAADTHALFWYLIASPRLGANAMAAFAEGAAGNGVIYIHAIVLAELHRLNRKMGNPFVFDDIMKQLKLSAQFVLVPLMPEDVLDFDAGQMVPEIHDSIIVGAARRAGAILLTRDTKIIDAGIVNTAW